MKAISSQSTFEQVKSTAGVLGLEVYEVSIGFELWAAESYQGGFVTLPAVIKEINLRIEVANIQKEEKSSVSNAIAAKLAGATEAALIQNGVVIGSCKTTVRNGGFIDIASSITADGAAVNSQRVKVSRSAQSLKKSQNAEFFTPKIFNGDLFYVC